MHKSSSSFFTLVFVSCLMSCHSAVDKTSYEKWNIPIEKTTQFHSNNNVSVEYFTRRGKRDSLYQEWTPSGNLQVEKWYDMDSLRLEKLYSKKGEVIKNIVYKDGRKYGLLFSSFCVNGVVKSPDSDSIIFVKPGE